MLMHFCLLKTYMRNPCIYFFPFFHPPTSLARERKADANLDRRTYIDSNWDVSFAEFLFLLSWFVKMLEVNFSYFAKIK
jgi:hypothetical protein